MRVEHQRKAHTTRGDLVARECETCSLRTGVLLNSLLGTIFERCEAAILAGISSRFGGEVAFSRAALRVSRRGEQGKAWISEHN